MYFEAKGCDMNNEWKDVPGYIGLYQVNRDGIFRSLDRYVEFNYRRSGKKQRFVKGKILKFGFSTKGYLQLHLSKKSVVSTLEIHRIVAKVWIPNPDNLPIVNHKNGITTDARVENLEWCTASQNMKHAYSIGLNRSSRGSSNSQSKLTEELVLEMKRRHFVYGDSQRSLAPIFGVSHSVVRNIMIGKKWSHVKMPHHWVTND